MNRSASTLHLPAGMSGRGSAASRQPVRYIMQEQRRPYAGRCATTSVVASIAFTFMRTVRLSFAPRIA
ncbi:hypothetical protein [Xanthomonas hortorum]|uniref:hypothetical protein n=1 Tax=Xanthomonas hortorum TaxID=56454 RepID=UPI003F6E21FE